MKQHVVIAIPLTRGQVAYVDECDADLAEHRWYANVSKQGRYSGATRKVQRKTVRMHRVVLERKLGRRIRKNRLPDHENGDVFDNQRSNLREVTYRQNCRNGSSAKGSSSKYRGVSWYTNRNKWVADLHINGKTKHLGYFRNEEDAARAWDQVAFAHFGEYARLNFPKPTKALKPKIVRTKRTPLPEGHIRQHPSGRFEAHYRQQYLGMFDIRKEAVAAIARFKKNNP